ncbi:MAG TPA: hypothetical protein VHO06_09770 [Polyangia bacterium]|nr:hypothetical protein [Polyangia bacterium]
MFRLNPSSEAEFVMIGNVTAALAVAALVWWKHSVPFSWVAGLAVLTFVALTLLVLHPLTAWLAALAGGLAMGASAGALLGGLAMRIHPLGMWVGVVVGLGLGLWVAMRNYGAVARLVQDNQGAR